jgi:hypothetical protein
MNSHENLIDLTPSGFPFRQSIPNCLISLSLLLSIQYVLQSIYFLFITLSFDLPFLIIKDTLLVSDICLAIHQPTKYIYT